MVIEGKARKDHLLTPRNLVKYRDNYLQVLREFPETLRVNDIEIAPEWEPSFRCAMLYGTLGISPNGRVKPCLRSESFFSNLSPIFVGAPPVLAIDPLLLESLEIFEAVANVRSSFVPQPGECDECELLHRLCNGCVVAKAFMEKTYQCPRKEVIGVGNQKERGLH